MNQRKTLIILPGWLQTSDFWRLAQERLPDWNVQVIDLPGFGKEPLVSTEWGVPEYTAWVKTQIEARSPKDIVLLGHSFGGRITAELASQHPSWLSSIILFGAPCLHLPPFSIRLKSTLAHFAKVSGIARILPQSLKPFDMRQAEDTGMGAIFRRAVLFSQTDALTKITVPTTLLWGAHDDAAPLHLANEMKKLVPHSTLVTLPDDGHHAHTENPTLFYATLANILTTTQRPVSAA